MGEGEGEVKKRQTAANLAHWTLVCGLGMLPWPFDEMLQCRIIMIFKVQAV